MSIELNIPFAANELGEELSIMFAQNRPDHVYITGSVGSGKTNLLYTIVHGITQHADKSAEVWYFDPFSPPDIRKGGETVRVFCQDESQEPNLRSFVETLYLESIERAKNYFSNTEEQETGFHMPYLIGIIGEAYMLTMLQDGDLLWRLEQVLRTSPITGIRLILFSQLPIGRLRIVNPRIEEMFNIRIALKASTDVICDALGIAGNVPAQFEKEAIEKLSVGLPGDVICKSYQDGKTRFSYGRIPYMRNDR